MHDEQTQNRHPLFDRNEAYRFAWRPLGSRSLSQSLGKAGDADSGGQLRRRDVWQAARAFIAFDH